MKAIIRLMLLFLLAGCTAENELPPLPTLVEFPSQTPSPEAQTISQNTNESPTETTVASTETLDSTATESLPSTIAPSPTIPAEGIWLTLDGAKAYDCASLDCEIVLELPAGLRFVPLETLEDWHTVRLDASTFVYIPVDTTRQLTEAEINASATPTSVNVQPSATVSISQNPTTNSVVSPPQNGGGNIIPPPISGGQNPPPPVSNVPTHTPVIVNTLIPTYTPNNANLTDIPPIPTQSGANELPFLPSLTPSPTQAPPPVIVLPPPS
jgi:hypothetical protein